MQKQEDFSHLDNSIRRQLTLFVEPRHAETIELVRKQFNPKQFELIRAHVTLCREDEIQNIEKVIENLHFLKEDEISIEFGPVKMFDKGKGVLLPAGPDNKEFQELRNKVLRGITDNPRHYEPHITLMHPRNSTCSPELFEEIEKIKIPYKLSFNRITLIEQKNGGVWNILQEFALNSNNKIN